MESNKLYEKIKPYFYSKKGLITKLFSYSGVVLKTPVSSFGIVAERTGDYYNIYRLYHESKTVVSLNIDREKAGQIVYEYFQLFYKLLIESYRNGISESIYDYVKNGIEVYSYNQYYKRVKIKR